VKASEGTTLFRPLSKRPSAITLTVRELLGKVRRGELRVPGFQRSLRWKREHVLKLLDSIWRGYPVGSLLFWKRPAEAASVPMGGTFLDAPAVTECWWVVDGQQRTTALAATLLDLNHAGDSRWVMCFDPEKGEFLAGPPPPDRIGKDVPVSVLGDLRRLQSWFRDCSLSDEVFDRVEEAQQRLLDYSIPAYVVETDDEQALRGVFARLNSTGVSMRADEVFQALLGAPSEGQGSSLDLDALQRDCDLNGFGVPPRREILKAVLAMSGLDPSRRLEDLGESATLNLVNPESASEALSRTVAFLQVECQIPHVSLIPYPVVFFILARWFHIFSNSEATTLKLLARWVWQGAVTGAHQRAAVSRMREQVRDIRQGEEQESLDRLLSRMAAPPAASWVLEPVYLVSARSRVEVLALWAQEPMDTDGPVSLAELMDGGRVSREIFHSQESKDLSQSVKALARTSANRVLLGATHSGLANELRTWQVPDSLEALQSHLIDEESFELLRDRKIEEFLTHRAEKLVQVVDTFTSKMAAWDEPMIRPLSAYYEEEEA
jgi:hypothetical protein